MKQVGRYRVLRALAQGGMGQVYLAEDPTLERRVALKLLHRDPNHNLQHEAKTLASLSHPNIVTIFEIGEHEGRDFIAMEYLPGRSLRELLNDKPPPSREELVAILSSVTVALAAAHRSSVLHRDIKPENIVTTPSGVKVVDFGIARRLEERASNITSPQELAQVLTASMGAVAATATPGTQTMFGTPAYMAPELLHGDPSSQASDVYSLGITFYECLAGHRPYEAVTLVELIAQSITTPPKRLDDPLGALVERMMARDPNARPTLREVSTALGGGPAVAPLPRRRAGLIVAGLGLIAAAGATVFAVTRASDEPAITVVDAAPYEGTIAIAPVEQDMPTWGYNRADPKRVASTLADVLGKTTGATLHVIPIDGATIAAAKAVQAEYLIVIEIKEVADQPKLSASIRVERVATGKELGEVAKMTRPSTELRQLLYDALDLAIGQISPGTKLARKPDRAIAQKLVSDGLDEIDGGDFDRARVRFDGAVSADPDFPDAWYGLALTLAWTEAEPELVLQATDRAIDIAPAGPRRDLVRGLGMFIRERYGEARKLLEPLEGKVSGRERQELLYFLAEANWHDGRFDEAERYFERGMEIAGKSRPMAIHPAMYLVARRQANKARSVFGLAGYLDPSEIEFSIRNYTVLLDGKNAMFRLASRLVLDKPYTDQDVAAAMNPFEVASFRVARATAAGDLAAARSAFDALWTDHVAGHRLVPQNFYTLETLGEVVVAAGMTDQAKQLVQRLAEESSTRPRRGYHRLATLTAALAKDPSLIVRSGVSERNLVLAAAAEAELGGDHERAAKLYGDLVAHPSYTWDYPERAALLRNLKVLRRTKDIAALCKDTLEPAIFRHAYLTLRRACRAS